MCGTNVCEWSCSTEIADKCPIVQWILAGLAVPVTEAYDTTWGELSRILTLEDQARQGRTGYQMMQWIQ